MSDTYEQLRLPDSGRVGIHGSVYRASGGRLLGHLAGMPVLLLTTTGRRSGRRRTVALTYATALRRELVRLGLLPATVAAPPPA